MNVKQFINEYSEKVYEMGLKRQESLINQSSRMMAIQGILLTIMYSLSTTHKITITLTLTSLLFSILAQLRFPHKYLPDIEKVRDVFSREGNPKEVSNETINEFLSTKNDEMYKSLCVINCIRSILITISSLTFISSIILEFIKIGA